MAYAQWIVAKIQSENTTIKIQKATLKWGKFYEKTDDGQDKDKELEASDINKIEIKSGKYAYVASCGRKSSWSGTEGSFDLYAGSTKIASFYWECPWGSGANTFRLTSENVPGYTVEKEGGNTSDGAIGDIRITCVKI